MPEVIPSNGMPPIYPAGFIFIGWKRPKNKSRKSWWCLSDTHIHFIGWLFVGDAVNKLTTSVSGKMILGR